MCMHYRLGGDSRQTQTEHQLLRSVFDRRRLWQCVKRLPALMTPLARRV